MADVTDYGPTIADLERKRDEINRTIATLRSLAGLPPGAEGASANGGPIGSVELTNKHFFGMKAPEAVILYLETVKEPRSATRIARDLVEHGLTTMSDSPANTIRTTLRRLHSTGDVVQVKKEWALPGWYPGLRRPKGRDPEKKRGARPSASKRRASRVKALRDGSMIGVKKATSQPATGDGHPMTYHQFMGFYRRAKRPPKEMGTAWSAYKAQHGM